MSLACAMHALAALWQGEWDALLLRQVGFDQCRLLGFQLTGLPSEHVPVDVAGLPASASICKYLKAGVN